MEHVLEDSGLSMPLVLLNDGYGSESFKQIDEIRRFVRRSERAPVHLASLRTSSELRSFAAMLADPATRLRALEEEVEELEVSLWHRSLWMACQVVPLAYISVSSPGAGCLWTGPYVKREQEAFAELRRVRPFCASIPISFCSQAILQSDLPRSNQPYVSEAHKFKTYCTR